MILRKDTIAVVATMVVGRPGAPFRARFVGGTVVFAPIRSFQRDTPSQALTCSFLARVTPGSHPPPNSGFSKGLLGLFSGWDTGEGHLGGATSSGGFIRDGEFVAGFGGDQVGSRAYGASMAGGVGVFISNAPSPRSLEGAFSTVEASLGPLSGRYGASGSIWLVQVLFTAGYGASFSAFSTWTNPGSTHGSPY